METNSLPTQTQQFIISPVQSAPTAGFQDRLYEVVSTIFHGLSRYVLLTNRPWTLKSKSVPVYCHKYPPGLLISIYCLQPWATFSITTRNGTYNMWVGRPGSELVAKYNQQWLIPVHTSLSMPGESSTTQQGSTNNSQRM